MNRTLVIFLFLSIVSCSKNKKEINKFSDEVFVKIADFQDRRLSDSLYQFFTHKNASYRRDAVLAFASIQDTTATEKIGEAFLNDKDQDVRRAAAFALGQIGGNKAFDYLTKASNNELIKSEVLEACGKSVRSSKINTIDFNSWGLYRLGIRGLGDSISTRRAIEFLDSKHDETVRLGAAHYFGRGPQDISSAELMVFKAAQEDSSVFVRMTATSALRKIKTDGSLTAAKKIINTDPDYRVRVNAVRVLQSFPISETKQVLYSAVADGNVKVAITATEVIKSVATQNEFKELVPLARTATNWRIQGNLYEAILSISKDKEIVEEVFKLYDQVNDPYAKAALITALGQSTIAYTFISDQLNVSPIFVIKSSAAAALVAINTKKEFTTELQLKFIDIYKQAIKTGDPAVIGTIVSALSDSTLGYKKVITDYTFLHEAKSKLSLPKDNEALQPLEEAIAYFEGKKTQVKVENEFNHPIDWALVKTIPRDQKVLIKTEKGNITIKLLVEEAPGSVANFVQLVNTGYFNSKNFHRVVPNFVIQAGCNRGDGWGSEDYSIRSEFSMRLYTEGSVGMASAGKDTEGTQWFITDSPTPHLDGRYTIFAVVEEGMSVVHNMEVGDIILLAELIK